MSLAKVRRKRKPKGWELIEEKLDEFDLAMREGFD